MDELEVLQGSAIALTAYSAAVQNLLETWSQLAVHLEVTTTLKAQLDGLAAQVGLTLPEEPSEVADVRRALG